MRELGIGVVFDLRSEKERVESPEVGFGDGNGSGIEGVWFEGREEQVGDGEVEKTVRRSLTLLRRTICLTERNAPKLTTTYLSLLHTHAEAFKAIFKHILNKPDTPILIHCTGTISPKSLSLSSSFCSVNHIPHQLTHHNNNNSWKRQNRRNHRSHPLPRRHSTGRNQARLRPHSTWDRTSTEIPHAEDARESIGQRTES